MPECDSADRFTRRLLPIFEKRFQTASITHVTFIKDYLGARYWDFINPTEVIGIV
jgi:hypothetical protein